MLLPAGYPSLYMHVLSVATAEVEVDTIESKSLIEHRFGY